MGIPASGIRHGIYEHDGGVKGFSQSEKDLLEHVSGLEPYGVTGAAMRSEVKILAPIEAPEQDIILSWA